MKMENIIVLFEVTIKKGKMEDYLAKAEELKNFLQRAEGFIHSERFSSFVTEGKLLSMSIWDSEESVSKWRNLMEHRESQKHGRLNDFVDYKITVVSPLRCYTMENRTEAPNDSNKYFKI